MTDQSGRSMVLAGALLGVAASTFAAALLADQAPAQQLNPCCYRWPHYPVAVSQDVRTSNYLWGNLTWDGSDPHKAAIAWGPGPSGVDPAGAAPDPVASARADAGSTLFRTTGADSGLRPAIDEFTSEPLPAEFPLNVSRMIELDLWLTGDVKPSSGETVMCYESQLIVFGPLSCEPTARESDYERGPCGGAVLDIDVLADGKRLAGAVGGQMIAVVEFDGPWPFLEDPRGEAGYHYCGYRMPAEVAVLPSGTIITVRVRHVDQGGIFQYGAAGEHRSQIRLPFFSPDEWLFRSPEVRAPEPGTGGPADEGGSGVGGSFAAGLGPLVAVPAWAVAARRGRGRAYALVALVALGGLVAGCVSNRGAGADGPTGVTLEGGTASIVHLADEGASVGNGSIVGTVHDDLGIPVAGVHVSVLGTSWFMDTDATGRFAFRDLRAAEYTLRFEKTTYQALEIHVPVREGFAARSDVTLVLLVPREADDRPHRHDYWDPGPSLVAFEGPVSARCVSTGTGIHGETCAIEASFTLPPRPDAAAAGRPHTVLPGTYDVEVTITWTEGDWPGDRLGLLVATNGGPPCTLKGCYRNWTQFAPRASGEPFHVRSSWEMTDMGHAELSTWSFLAFEPPSDHPGAVEAGRRYGDSQSRLPTFHAKVVLHKGVLGYEPAHPGHWSKGPRILVGTAGRITQPQHTSTCIPSGSYTPPASPYTVYVTPKTVVPSDTDHLLATWNASRDTTPHTDWVLAFHAANVGTGPGVSQWRFLDAPTGSRPEQTVWKVPLKPGEADTVYATASKMRFAVFAKDTQAACLDWDGMARVAGLKLNLDVSALRDAS